MFAVVPIQTARTQRCQAGWFLAKVVAKVVESVVWHLYRFQSPRTRDPHWASRCANDAFASPGDAIAQL